MRRLNRSISISMVSSTLAWAAGCSILEYLRFDPCPECHLSLSDLSGMYERDPADSCNYAFTGDAAMLPDFDEALAEIEAEIAQDPNGCLPNDTPSPTLSTGVCSEGGYLFISRVSNQFSAIVFYFDPTTKRLIGATAYGDFGLCGPFTYYISHVECGEQMEEAAICP